MAVSWMKPEYPEKTTDQSSKFLKHPKKTNLSINRIEMHMSGHLKMESGSHLW
jgi:hypothetical protein